MGTDRVREHQHSQSQLLYYTFEASDSTHLVLEIGNSTVTPVVSNLRIDPALVDGYLPFAHFFLPP